MFGKIKKAVVTKLKHIRGDGSIGSEIAQYCPECGFYKLERKVLPGMDFDEHGWYQFEEYTCQNSDCKHVWKEKVIIQGGGSAHYYGNKSRSL
jgi:hypothetical protein